MVLHDQSVGVTIMSSIIKKVRTAEEIDAVRALVWEFFDVLRERYPELSDEAIEERLRRWLRREDG